MKKNKIVEPFTQVKEWYWECGLDIYEVNIIARIASWQRENRKFYEGKKTIAKIFNCDHKVIFNRFENLENKGIIIRGEKVGRAYSYRINEHKLHQLRIGTPEVPIDETLVPQRYSNGTPEVLYNTTQTSNKTSLREDETLFERSTSKPKKTITNAEITKLAQSID